MQLGVINVLPSQEKYDFNWILGRDPNVPELNSGGTYINFKNGQLESSYFNIIGKMDSYSFISDTKGNLQFYTNGCQILSNNHQQMENGDEISPGISHDYYCETTGYGSYLEYLGLLTLPRPGYDSKYVLFHLSRHPDYLTCDLLYSEVDMTQNNGLGKVVQKNQFLIQDTLSLTLSAVRHANGRDWWLISPKDTTEKYYFFLLDTAGVHGPYINQPDVNWIEGHWRNIYCGFSPDGNKFVRLGEKYASKFKIYDFDRCSGELFNPIILTFPDDVAFASWASFSPNSRYLYVTNNLLNLYQYDLQSSNIDSSRQLVGVYDGTVDEQGFSTKLFSMALAPDGKIYLSSSNSVRTLHVIHKPNEPGIACDFRQQDVELPANILFYMPNLPHYRVYDVPGSLCDTLGINAPVVSFWRSESDTSLMVLGRRFFDLSYDKIINWFWDFGDGDTSAAQNPTHVFPGAGVYNVCLTVCNLSGACDTLCRDVYVATIGIEPVFNEYSIKVYPNPTSNDVIFEVCCDGWLRIWSVTGSLIDTIHLQSGQNSCSIGHLSAGIYFYETSFPDGKKANGKIIKY